MTHPEGEHEIAAALTEIGLMLRDLIVHVKALEKVTLEQRGIRPVEWSQRLRTASESVPSQMGVGTISQASAVLRQLQGSLRGVGEPPSGAPGGAEKEKE